MMAPSKTFMFGRRRRQTIVNTYDLIYNMSTMQAMWSHAHYPPTFIMLILIINSPKPIPVLQIQKTKLTLWRRQEIHLLLQHKEILQSAPSLAVLISETRKFKCRVCWSKNHLEEKKERKAAGKKGKRDK